VQGSAPTQMCEIHGGGHGIVSSTGSFLSHVFGGGQPKVPQTVVDVNGNPVPYDPNRPPNATGQGALPPGDQNGKTTENKKNPLKKIFGIFGGKKKQDPANPKPDDKGDSP
jgi:hypothetical protein